MHSTPALQNELFGAPALPRERLKSSPWLSDTQRVTRQEAARLYAVAMSEGCFERQALDRMLKHHGYARTSDVLRRDYDMLLEMARSEAVALAYLGPLPEFGLSRTGATPLVREVVREDTGEVVEPHGEPENLRLARLSGDDFTTAKILTRASTQYLLRQVARCALSASLAGTGSAGAHLPAVVAWAKSHTLRQLELAAEELIDRLSSAEQAFVSPDLTTSQSEVIPKNDE